MILSHVIGAEPLIADGYTRATGKMSMVIAQNGPGITGLVTPIKTAYWNHTPTKEFIMEKVPVYHIVDEKKEKKAS